MVYDPFYIYVSCNIFVSWLAFVKIASGYLFSLRNFISKPFWVTRYEISVGASLRETDFGKIKLVFQLLVGMSFLRHQTICFRDRLQRM